MGQLTTEMQKCLTNVLGFSRETESIGCVYVCVCGWVCGVLFRDFEAINFNRHLYLPSFGNHFVITL